jgi:hypothetical protein
MDATGCAYQSLANWSWVASHVPINNRVAGLSWTHHRLVAHVGTEQQKQLLETAKAKGISVTEFERELKGEPEEEKKPLKQITVPEGWTVDDANKALEIVSSYRQGLERLSAALDAVDEPVQRYCAECPYNN